MNYVLAPSAAGDLESLWQHLADEASEAAADRVIEAISERCEMLGEFPKAGRLRPEIGLDVRCFPVEKHLIYYRQEGALVRDLTGSSRKPRSSRRLARIARQGRAGIAAELANQRVPVISGLVAGF